MGEGMTEAQLRELTQGAVSVGLWFVVLAGLTIFLATPRRDGEPRRWTLVMAWLNRHLETRRYVAPRKEDDEDHADTPVSAHRKAESENRAEMENGGKSAGNLSASQLTKLLEDERRKAAAEALGTLIGAGLIVEKGRTRAMIELFGPPGRLHTQVRPFVDRAEAAARASRPPEAEAEEEPAQVLAISAGTPNERLILK